MSVAKGPRVIGRERGRWIRSHAAKGLILMVALLALTGCASIVGTAVYHAALLTSTPLYEAHVASAQPPYRATWLSASNRGIKKETPARLPSGVIAEGRYRNWIWEVKGGARVAASWHRWRDGAVRPRAHSSTTGDPPGKGRFTWSSGFARLWTIMHYFVGRMPLPADITVYLLPHGQPYHIRRTATGKTHVHLVLVSPFPAPHGKAMPALSKDAHDYALALGRVALQLERMELAVGRFAAPRQGPDRQIRDEVNGFCVDLSAQRALLYGTDFPVLHLSVSETVVRLDADTYHAYPHKAVSRMLYAMAIMAHQVTLYMNYMGVRWPKTGLNRHAIADFVGLCRTLVHDPADLRHSTIDAAKVKPAPAWVFGVPLASARAGHD